MGRKKIEIRPLTDERNRNVTFLKRKAGLMKKAWELSVLCGAEVSILIFNNAGKPYEFSSRELDTEIDRYLEYEGLIERRRGEEFAAMAEAGEDDEDDDEDEGAPGRKNSKTSTAAAVNGVNGKPVKSLKGKESFKKRMYSRRDMARGAGKRKRGGDRDGKQGFIDGILSSSDDEGAGSGGSSDGLAYALNMHQHPAFASLPYPASLSGGQSSSNIRSTPIKPDLNPYASSSYPPLGSGSSLPAQYGLSGMSGGGSGGMGSMSLPPNMGGIQWDANLAARYAEFQLQQNHQRQQRLLLERQRAQLAELGVNLDGDRRLLEDVFGASASAGRGMQSQSHGQGQGQGHGHHASSHGQQNHHTPVSHGGMSIDSNGPLPSSSTGQGVANGTGSVEPEFVWPSFTTPAGAGAGQGASSSNATGNGDTDGRGYYTTPESYEHAHSHMTMQDQWAHAQGQSQAHGQGQGQSGLPMGYGNQDDAGASGGAAQFTSPMSYDEERRRREDMYVHSNQQGQGQGQGQVGGGMGMGHHEKRVRVA